LTWLILSVAYFFLSEPLVKLLFPGFHDVGIWLITVFSGLGIIFLIMLVALILNMARRRERTKSNS